MKKKPSFLMGVMPIIFMIVSLTIGVGFMELRAEPIILISAIFAGILAYRLGYKWNELQEGVIDKIARALPATLILWSVGLLIGSWMYCGTVPMLIYYGVGIISPQYLLLTAFIISAILSMVTGTSWGSAGTIGVAIMGIAKGLNVNLAAAAGAVVAGAYFGDKLSPFSDTTNLAPIAAGSELYEHIRHMLYTTVPATIVSLIVYYIAGRGAAGGGDISGQVIELQEQLSSVFKFSWVLVIPVIIIMAGSVMKLPTLPVMIVTSLFSVLLGVFVQGFSLKDGFVAIIKGFNVEMANTGIEYSNDIIKLINRGGVASVTATTVLVFCAMGFAGIMSKAGFLDAVLEVLLKKVKTVTGIVLSTIASCCTVAFVTGSSYLSILIPGDLFSKAYVERNLHPKNLSRTLEDSGTVLVPLIPWSAAGAYMTATLGVNTLEYLPWAVLNYTGIIFAIILAVTGIGIAKITDEEKAQYIEKGSVNK
ncbi:MAG: Na+/H+ antiporter NhaC [Tissierellia bacterium]|nr:Na+/H+ antiporter NhaC [Tissierellia bacterium]